MDLNDFGNELRDLVRSSIEEEGAADLEEILQYTSCKNLDELVEKTVERTLREIRPGDEQLNFCSWVLAMAVVYQAALNYLAHLRGLPKLRPTATCLATRNLLRGLTGEAFYPEDRLEHAQHCYYCQYRLKVIGEVWTYLQFEVHSNPEIQAWIHNGCDCEVHQAFKELLAEGPQARPYRLMRPRPEGELANILVDMPTPGD